MRALLIGITFGLLCSGSVQAQTSDCTVTGYLFNADGTPAAQAQVNVISVVRSGSSYVLAPVTLASDEAGFTSFVAPRLSTIWIVGTALGLSSSSDVAIPIPDAVSATLDVLRESAQPPVSGFNLSSGSSPTLALSLQGFGINLNAGATPSAIDDSRLSENVVLRNTANIFAAEQIFSNGLQLQGQLGVTGDVVASGPYRFQFSATPAPGEGVGRVWASAETIGDDLAGDINFAVAAHRHPGGGRNNVTTSWGYNNNGDGNRVIATEPTLNYRIETFYVPAAGREWMESHLQYESTRGRVLRPFGFQIDRNTDESSLQLQADSFSYLGPDERQYVKFMPGAALFVNRTALASFDNNHAFVQQLNAAGTYFLPLVFLDSADRIQLGGGPAATDVVVSGGNMYVGGIKGVKLTSAGGAGLSLSTSNGGAAFLAGTELPGDPSPATGNGWKLFARDDGTGKTELCVAFASGPPQCFAKQQ